MKIKFTKASKKDKNLVTVSLFALDKVGVKVKDRYGTVDYPTGLSKHSEFVMSVDDELIVFTVNRSFKTATTKSFPRHLKMPRVGRPTMASVRVEARWI